MLVSLLVHLQVDVPDKDTAAPPQLLQAASSQARFARGRLVGRSRPGERAMQAAAARPVLQHVTRTNDSTALQAIAAGVAMVSAESITVMILVAVINVADDTHYLMTGFPQTANAEAVFARDDSLLGQQHGTWQSTASTVQVNLDDEDSFPEHASSRAVLLTHDSGDEHMPQLF